MSALASIQGRPDLVLLPGFLSCPDGSTSQLVERTRKPIAQVARELGVNEGTLGNWVA